MQNRHTRSSLATDLAYMSSVTSGKSSFFVVRICVLPQVALWGKGDGSTESDNTSVSTIMIDVSKHFATTKIAIGDYLRI